MLTDNIWYSQVLNGHIKLTLLPHRFPSGIPIGITKKVCLFKELVVKYKHKQHTCQTYSTLNQKLAFKICPICEDFNMTVSFLKTI